MCYSQWQVTIKSNTKVPCGFWGWDYITTKDYWWRLYQSPVFRSKSSAFYLTYHSYKLTLQSLQYNKPSSISGLLTKQPNHATCSIYPANLQLSISNALPITLGFKFLTDLSTFKLQVSTCYLECSTTIFTLILLKLILFSILKAAENSRFSSFPSSL